MTMLTASRRAVCELPPDPTEVMRELQAIATAHPELREKMKRACDLIGKQSSFSLDIFRTLVGSRLVEHLL